MKKGFRGMKFSLFVLAMYIVLYFFFPEKTLSSIWKAADIVKFIIPVFAIIIVFTAVINYFFNPKQIASHIGTDSGAKGWMIALGAGVVSHGPMYAWYPMIEDLKKHGLRDGLIATFFYSRSIKVPLLPLMIEYFGLTFTVILSVYVLIASLIQGLLIEWWCRGCKAESEDN